MIDLHLHTTASDGRCSPSELVDRAHAAGLRVMAVTDHDTTDAMASVRDAAAVHGIDAVSGIEITAVEDGFDVHVLGYFVDPQNAGFQRFLTTQRESRIARVEQIGQRLAQLGRPIDVDALLTDARMHASRSIGRPQVARALIAAGHVATMDEAFAAWLGRGCPAFVPRAGASPETVIATIHDARGLASLAHPGRTRIDPRIAPLRKAGLDALEVFHSDHDESDRARYRELARSLGLLVTGGSDFHGDPSRAIAPGSTALPPDDWDALIRAHTDRV